LFRLRFLKNNTSNVGGGGAAAGLAPIFDAEQDGVITCLDIRVNEISKVKHPPTSRPDKAIQEKMGGSGRASEHSEGAEEEVASGEVGEVVTDLAGAICRASVFEASFEDAVVSALTNSTA
jgi:hypothetical protein